MSTSHSSRRSSRTRHAPGLMLDSLSLHEAAWNGDATVLSALLAISLLKPRIDDPDMEWGFRTPLHIASHRGHVNCCRVLLENGAGALSRMYQGWTPAHCAAEIGKLEILKLLADYSTDNILTPDDYGDTPEKLARLYGHMDCVEFLQSSWKMCEDNKTT